MERKTEKTKDNDTESNYCRSTTLIVFCIVLLATHVCTCATHAHGRTRTSTRAPRHAAHTHTAHTLLLTLNEQMPQQTSGYSPTPHTSHRFLTNGVDTKETTPTRPFQPTLAGVQQSLRYGQLLPFCFLLSFSLSSNVFLPSRFLLTIFKRSQNPTPPCIRLPDPLPCILYSCRHVVARVPRTLSGEEREKD